MPTLKTVTLGCKVNQYETEYVRQGLAKLGYRDPVAGQTPDLCLVNTCAVTAEGEAKGRKLIRRLAHDNPGMGIIVMGCYATRAPQEVAALPGIVEVVTDKRRPWAICWARLGVADLPERHRRGFPGRRRAYVKVQDGCQMHCAFCIIPQLRPVLWTSAPSPKSWPRCGRHWPPGIAKSCSPVSIWACTGWDRPPARGPPPTWPLLRRGSWRCRASSACGSPAWRPPRSRRSCWA